MSAEAWIVLATLIAMVAVMARGLLSPPAAVVGATGFVYVFDVIEADDALSGLANPTAMSVAGLYVVAGAVSRAGLIQPLVRRLVGADRIGRGALARMATPAAVASAFLANTPIVAMLVPTVVQWCDDRRVSASRFLLPLSYATILGGTLTVIGTSTNLVAAGLVADAGLGEIAFFEPATVSWPIVLVGLGLVIALGPLVLPPRRAPTGDAADDRPFAMAMEVVADAPLVGCTVEAAGLRKLEGVYLVAIERADGRVAPVAPDRRLDAGDRLVFVGDLDRVMDLRSREGLAVSTEGSRRVEGDLHEVVVSSSSVLVGRTLRDAGFRARHQAAVVGVHRSGAAVTSKLGDLEVRGGDTLLLLTGPEFAPDAANARSDFAVCSHLGPVTPREPAVVPTIVTIVALALVVVLPALDLVSVLRAVTIAGGLLVVGRAIRPGEVWDLIDLRIVAMIAGAFGLGRAVATSGLAAELASGIVDLTDGTGDLGVVLGLLLATMVLTELVTNVAAVALVFPLAVDVATATDLDPKRMVIGVAVASSASFLTPIGYQTNTMVWGPGRYRMSDYLRLGIPLWLIAWVGTSLMITTG